MSKRTAGIAAGLAMAGTLASMSAVTDAGLRRPGGSLAQPAGPAGCISVESDLGCAALTPAATELTAVATSRDGRTVYVAVDRRSGDDATHQAALVVFARNRRSGSLSQLGAGDGEVPVGRGQVDALAVAPDGRDVYVVVNGADGDLSTPRVLGFARDPATGRLRPRGGAGGCLAGRRGVPGCGFVAALEPSVSFFDTTAALVIAPDGHTLYVPVGHQRIAVVRRDRRTGRLAESRARGGCIALHALRPGRCVTMRPRVADGWAHLVTMTITADGRTLYAVRADTQFDEAGREYRQVVTVLRRDRRTGALTQLAARAGCVASATSDFAGGHGGCATDDGLADVSSLVAASDGRQVYAANGARLLVLRRDRRTGALTPTAQPSCGGDRPPRALCAGQPAMLLAPDDDALIAAGSALWTIGRDPRSGRLHTGPGERCFALSIDVAYRCRRARGVGRDSYLTGGPPAPVTAMATAGENVYALADDATVLVFRRR